MGSFKAVLSSSFKMIVGTVRYSLRCVGGNCSPTGSENSASCRSVARPASRRSTALMYVRHDPHSSRRTCGHDSENVVRALRRALLAARRTAHSRKRPFGQTERAEQRPPPPGLRLVAQDRGKRCPPAVRARGACIVSRNAVATVVVTIAGEVARRLGGECLCSSRLTPHVAQQTTRLAQDQTGNVPVIGFLIAPRVVLPLPLDRQRMESMESTMVKIAALKPIGMASDTTAAMAKPGFRRAPQRVAEVPDQVLQRAPAARIPDRLADGVDAAQAQPRPAPSPLAWITRVSGAPPDPRTTRAADPDRQT